MLQLLLAGIVLSKEVKRNSKLFPTNTYTGFYNIQELVQYLQCTEFYSLPVQERNLSRECSHSLQLHSSPLQVLIFL